MMADASAPVVDDSAAPIQTTAEPTVGDTAALDTAAVIQSKPKPPPRVWNGRFPFRKLYAGKSTFSHSYDGGLAFRRTALGSTYKARCLEGAVSSWRRPPLRKALTDTTIELRNNIYHRALDWNCVQAPMTNLKRKLEAVDNDPGNNSKARIAASEAEHNTLYALRQTPTILLLCAYITREALPILQNTPLSLDFGPRHRHYEIMHYVTISPFKAKRDHEMPIFKWTMMSLPTIKQVKKASFTIPN